MTDNSSDSSLGLGTPDPSAAAPLPRKDGALPVEQRLEAANESSDGYRHGHGNEDSQHVHAEVVTPQPPDDAETFPRAYVQQLRDENAKYRQRAGRADEAVQRLLATTVRSTAAAHLADPGDLLTFSNTEDLIDDDGWPDADRITAAAETLATSKPHLALRRPRGDIGQAHLR